MRLPLAVALVSLTLPAVGRAQDAPERLLPASAQIYLRWDGAEAHRDAFAATALGKILRGSTGDLAAGSFAQVKDALGAALTAQQLLGGVPPKRLKQLQEDVAEAPKVLDLLGRHGFLLAVEARALEPLQVQATLIVPDVGDTSKPLFGIFRLATAVGQIPVAEKQLDGRDVSVVQAGPVQVVWWLEGKHAVLTIGTDAAEEAVKRTRAKEDRLTESPLFRRVRGFKEFATGLRAYVDVAALVKLSGARGNEVGALLDELGLGGLKSLTLYSGFDGPAERSLTEWEMPGPRKGLLTVAGGKPFALADVPALPPDVVSWSVTNFDAAKFYDVALAAAQRIAALVAPDEKVDLKGYVQMADQALGVSLRADLLGSLGGRFASYSAPSEGPLLLGQTFLFQVKDAKKLLATLEQIAKSLGKAANVDVAIKTRAYHGVDVHEVHVRQQGFVFLPTFAIDKDWLVVSLFPQPVQGCILRNRDELPAWKPEASTVEALNRLPREFISVSYSDPRPTVTQLLSLAPLAAGAVRSFLPDAKFEVGSVPNSQEVTRHLFPNVSVVSDDGKVVRMETRASLGLPFDLGGLFDVYALFALASLSRIL